MCLGLGTNLSMKISPFPKAVKASDYRIEIIKYNVYQINMHSKEFAGNW